MISTPSGQIKLNLFEQPYLITVRVSKGTTRPHLTVKSLKNNYALLHLDLISIVLSIISIGVIVFIKLIAGIKECDDIAIISMRQEKQVVRGRHGSLGIKAGHVHPGSFFACYFPLINCYLFLL